MTALSWMLLGGWSRMITALEQEGSEAGWAGGWPKLRISEKV